MDVAKEILNQMVTIDRMMLWSWGAHAYKAIPPNNFKTPFGDHMGGLVFKVQGKKFGGHVAVILDPSDTYNIHFGRLVKGEFKESKPVARGMYVEDFVDYIDGEVEA